MRIIKLFILFLFSKNVCGQLETNNWFFNGSLVSVKPSGVTTGLGYPTNFPVPYSSTSISDVNGNLLFAFNGLKIIDRNMNVMPALANLSLNAGNSKMLIQKIPNSTKYYLFYSTKNNTPSVANSSWTLKYALIDLSLNGGNGDVIVFDQIIANNVSQAFTLVEGDNTSQTWLVTHRFATADFFAYKITSAGLDITPVFSNAGTVSNIENYIFRDLKTSPNGKMIAGLAYRDYTVIFAYTQEFVEVFDFDALTGLLSYKIRTIRKPGYFGTYFSLDFSPDNRLLYYSRTVNAPGLQPCGYSSSSVTQFNLCYADSIMFSKYSTVLTSYLITCAPYFTPWTKIQLGADKKIHIPFGGTTVSTINNPNRIGANANYLFNSYTVPVSNYSSIGVPDFHHKQVQKAVINNIIYDGGCYPRPMSFSITNDTINDVRWNFGDPASPDNTSDQKKPTHVFSAPGYYTVYADLYNSQGEFIERVSEVIEVKDPDKRILDGYPMDTTVCANEVVKIKLNAVNGVFRWYRLSDENIEVDNIVSDSININRTDTWYVEMRQNDCNGCVMLDSITVTVLPKPSFSLGSDRNICEGDSLRLMVNDNAASFVWNTGEVTNSILVKETGLYWVEAEYNNNGCPQRDSIIITKVPGVDFALPSDTVLCNNATLLLKPGLTGVTYQWQNGSTNTQFLVTAPGTYWVKIRSSNGCERSDTINVSYLNVEQVQLGRDTVLCEGSILQLKAGIENVLYEWSTGESGQTIEVVQNGSYWVKVNNGVCIVSDTVDVKFSTPPMLFLGNDTTICENDKLRLEPGIVGGIYTWQDNSDKVIYNVEEAGVYWLTVNKEGCTVSDTIKVTQYTIPPLDIGNDRRFCTGDSMTLSASPGFIEYLWNDGSSFKELTVHKQGEYYLTAKTLQGCKASDTLKVLSLFPLPEVDLGPDTDLCAGEVKQLKAGEGYRKYIWNDGSTGPAITVNSAGQYNVNVTDINGCKGGDTIIVKSILPAPSNFLGKDTSICSYGDLLLRSEKDFRSYYWVNGKQDQSIKITQPGTYWLKVIDANGCQGTDTVLVSQKQCMEGFYIPTAFTPNNDGKNDVFAPFLFGNIEYYQFEVYNRWGQLVFSTSTLTRGWDGTYKQVPQPNASYIWTCRFKFVGQEARVEKGTFVLIR